MSRFFLLLAALCPYSLALSPAVRSSDLTVRAASAVVTTTLGQLAPPAIPHSTVPTSTGRDVIPMGAKGSEVPVAPNGRRYPTIAATPAAVAARLDQLETRLRDSGTDPALLPDLAHEQQVVYRVLSHQTQRAQAVKRALPLRWQPVFERHIAARRQFLAMHKGRVRPSSLPAWRIIPPEPLHNLLAYYKKAETTTGIPWQVLAAINLVETAMGRIDGVSVANAQGPMQFLPTTWAQRGIGAGNIHDPHDAIQAAARYLVYRGGLQNIRKGLWGYNNSDHYGRAVLHYAALMEEDPQAFIGLYHWEVHFGSAAGDLWLPVGYEQAQPIAVNRYLQRAPWSAPPPGSSGW